MLYDGISLVEGSSFTNMTVATGNTFPVDADIGELFYKTGSDTGLHVFNGTVWQLSGTGTGSFTITGDVAGTLNGGTDVLTLATVNPDIGLFGDAGSVPVISVNNKGLVLGASSTAIQISESQISDGALLARIAGNEIISGGWTFNNAVVGVDPMVSTHLTTKSYVDSLVQGLSWKNAVRVATTVNITLSATQTIDGVAVVAGNRVLVKNQTTPQLNGIYVVAAGAWARAVDMDGSPDVGEVNGAAVYVTDGTANGDTTWTQTATVATVGAEALTFVQLSGAGGGSTSASTLTGTTLAANVASSSLTSVGTLTGLTTSGVIQVNGSGDQVIIGTNAGQRNTLVFNSNGVGDPTFTTRSIGTKIVLYQAVGASAVDFAIGIGSQALWMSVQGGGESFRWYHGQTNTMTLSSSTLTAPNFSGVGTLLTALNATNLASGTVSTARLGSGAASALNVLRGDGTWASPFWFNHGGTLASTIGNTGGGVILLGNPEPSIVLKNTNGSAGNQSSYITSFGAAGTIVWQLLNDVGTAGINFFTVTRSGNTATNVTFTSTAFNLAVGSGGLQLNGAAGTTGQVLTSNGAAAAPTWNTPSAAAGTLTGTTLASNVVSSSLTSIAAGATVGGIPVGYSTLPRTTTFNLAARGTRVAVTAGFTVPASTYAAGDAFSFYNDSANAIEITQGSGLTLRQEGTPNIGNRTLAARGTCFLWFNTATEAIIGGNLT